MLLLIGMSLLLVVAVFVSMYLAMQERITDLERALEDNRVNTVNPMDRWDDDTIVAARNAYLTRGWIPEGCRLFEFRLYGVYRFVAGVVAANETEAIEKLKLGYIAYGTTPEDMNGIPETYGGWCDSGYEAFICGLAALRVDQPVFSADYETAGVLRVYPADENLARYEFRIVYDDPEDHASRCEYTAQVVAGSVDCALDQVLTGQVVLRNPSNPSEYQNMAYNGRGSVALAMLSATRAEWSFACFDLGEADTFATWHKPQ